MNVSFKITIFIFILVVFMDFFVLLWSVAQFYGFWIYKYGGFFVFINF
jgi:hypothetical protein